METHGVLITALGLLVALSGISAYAARGFQDAQGNNIKPWSKSSARAGFSFGFGFASPHIVGGNEAIPHSYPHQVVLIVRGISSGQGGSQTKHVCGGSLLTELWVITAAHCVDAGLIFKNNEVDSEKNKLVITAGVGVHSLYGLYSSKVQLINASEISIHPEWSSYPINNDIALIKLENAVNLDGSYAKTIRLPKSSDETKSFTGSTATTIGWGTTNENEKLNDKLHAVDSKVLGNLYCKLRYLFLLIRDTNICTSGQGGKGTCQSDRGGPLIVKEDDGTSTLIGITSFGFGCKWWFPNVFTKITSYLEWIYKVTGMPTRT